MRTVITSNCTRPSMLISFISREPVCFDWNIFSLTLVTIPLTRPKYGNEAILSVAARPRRYGRSKLPMLYPVRMSASHASTNWCHERSISDSVSKARTCAPEIGAVSLRQKMFLRTGWVEPCSVTWFAIWMIASFSASGKIPGRPEHSMSKERMRIGAIRCHSPSG